MHEMSIVTGILDIALKEARSAGARVINSVEIQVGQMAGVEVAALEFCFEVARRGTLAAEAALVIDTIPGRGRCADCNKEVAVDFHLATCPACGQGFLEVLQGRELRVRSISVD